MNELVPKLAPLLGAGLLLLGGTATATASCVSSLSELVSAGIGATAAFTTAKTRRPTAEPVRPQRTGSSPAAASSFDAPAEEAPAPSTASTSAAEPATDKGVGSDADAMPSLHFNVLEPALDAPRCENVYAYIVSIFPDPESNIATLASSKNGRGGGRRVGARVGDYRVIAIGENAPRQSSAVWLSRNGEVCQVLLRDDNPVRQKAVKRARQRRATQYQARQRKLAKVRERKAKRKKRKSRKKRR